MKIRTVDISYSGEASVEQVKVKVNVTGEKRRYTGWNLLNLDSTTIFCLHPENVSQFESLGDADWRLLF